MPSKLGSLAPGHGCSPTITLQYCVYAIALIECKATDDLYQKIAQKVTKLGAILWAKLEPPSQAHS